MRLTAKPVPVGQSIDDQAQTRYVVCIRVMESARKHGISDDAMLHALRHATRTIPGTNDVTLFISGDHTGRLLEVGVEDLDTEDERIIHAMELRPTFYKFL